MSQSTEAEMSYRAQNRDELELRAAKLIEQSKALNKRLSNKIAKRDDKVVDLPIHNSTNDNRVQPMLEQKLDKDSCITILEEVSPEVIETKEKNMGNRIFFIACLVLLSFFAFIGVGSLVVFFACWSFKACINV
mmetsp:Transcript_18668/g.25881  ORF Transcript_18668/g.25881 Transcript_18668/m.25881 type:complete len:134 (+) Transcript_18668:502-903(+)